MAKKPNLTVAKRSLAELTADALREAIVSGGLRPGSRLTEVELARQTGASRGTVREALAARQQEGLVDCVRYSAWSVAPLDALKGSGMSKRDTPLAGIKVRFPES